jgi:hypothetical protein
MVAELAERVKHERQATSGEHHCHYFEICIYPQCDTKPERCKGFFKNWPEVCARAWSFRRNVLKSSSDGGAEGIECLAALQKLGFDPQEFKACAVEKGDDEVSKFCALNHNRGKCACGSGSGCRNGKEDGTGEFFQCVGVQMHGKPKCMGQTSDWHHFFSTVMVINLERRTERREYMKDMLTGIGVPVTKIRIFNAVDVLQWGTIPFISSLKEMLHVEPASLFLPGNDCCTKRLSDNTHRCDVSGCGLFASGLSHYSAIRLWLDSTADAPDKNQAVLIMEDGKLLCMLSSSLFL